MPQEALRGCGYRTVGSLYLVGKGRAMPCDAMPLVLKSCDCCGFEVPFFRGFKWISKKYIQQLSVLTHLSPEFPSMCGVRQSIRKSDKEIRYKCTCHPSCPVCHPENNDLKKYGLMWVGGRHYTPHSFIKEAQSMGVSKKIAKLPKDIVFGETWVMLAQKKVPIYSGVKFGVLNVDPKRMSAIFYAFIPQAVEMLVWKSKATDKYLKELRDRGVTPIIIKDGDKAHA